MHEERADVVVAGAGGAGLVAAGTVATLAPDLRVLLLERDLAAPCNSAIASNFIPAAGTRFQDAAGIQDGPELLARDVAAKNGGRSDPELTLALCRRSADAVHFMVDHLGVTLEFAPELTWLGHSVPRMHAHPERGGPPVLSALLDAVRRLDVTVLDGIRLRELECDASGAVTGVIATRGDTDLRVSAGCTVIATGGYNASRTLLQRFIPRMADAPSIGARTDTGDGILAAQAIGARLALMSGYQGRDCISEDGTRVTPPVINEGGFAVNALARRFVNELEDYSALAQVYRDQPGQHAWFIWDRRIQDLTGDVLVMRQAEERGGIRRGETIEDIAHAWGLPASALAESLDLYNEGVRRGRDAFDRPRLTQPLEAPFYSARITGAIAHTQGGLVVDPRGRVLREDGKPVPGLYAGGNALAGLSGDTPGGYLSGNGLLVAYTTGFIIGEAIARDLSAGVHHDA